MSCRVQGYLYDASGDVLTSGVLHITLTQDIVFGGMKVAPIAIAYDLSELHENPGFGYHPLGYIDVALVPNDGASPAGTSYFVEYDPDPTDVAQPRRTKSGYWSNYWAIPDVATANIGNFADGLRGLPTENWMPLDGVASAIGDVMTLGTTPSGSSKHIYANQASADNPGIRYHAGLGLWQVSNNGTVWADIPTAVSGLTAASNFNGDVTGTYTAIQIKTGVVGSNELEVLSGLVAGTYGSSTLIPVITIDTRGRITAVSTTAVTGGSGGAEGAAGGDLSSSYPNPTVVALRGVQVSSTLPTTTGQVLRYNASLSRWEASLDASALTGLNASNLASGTVPLGRIGGLTTAQCASPNVSQWTNDAGYQTAAGTVAGFSGSLAGDVTGTQGATVLANSGVTAGTYGSATAFPIVQVDAKGRVVSASVVNMAGVYGRVGQNETITGYWYFANNLSVTSPTSPAVMIWNGVHTSKARVASFLENATYLSHNAYFLSSQWNCDDTTRDSYAMVVYHDGIRMYHAPLGANPKTLTAILSLTNTLATIATPTSITSTLQVSGAVTLLGTLNVTGAITGTIANASSLGGYAANTYPRLSAANTFTANQLLQATRPTVEFLHGSSAYKGRVASYADGMVHLTANLSYNGSAWNADDSGQASMIAAIAVGGITLFSTPSGASPRTPATVAHFDVNGMALGGGVAIKNTSQIGPFVNVKHYGATGDGTTDDTTAIAAAWTAAAGRPIYYPAGSYLDTGTHALAEGQIVYGDGPKKSVILTRHAMSSVFTTTVTHFQVRDLSVYGNKTSNGYGAITINSLSSSDAQVYGLVENVVVENCTHTGFIVNGAWKVRFVNCRSKSNNGNGFSAIKHSTNNTYPSHITWEDCHAEYNAGDGWYVYTADAAPTALGFVWVDCICIYNTGHGYVVTNVLDANFIGSYAAFNTAGSGIRATSSHGVSVHGGGFHNNTDAVYLDASTAMVDGVYFRDNTSHIRVKSGSRGESRACYINGGSFLVTESGAVHWNDNPTSHYVTGTVTMLTDTGNAIGPVSARVYNSAAQSTSSGSNTTLTWNTEAYDKGGMHSTSTNTSRLTVPSNAGGLYIITAGVCLAASSGGSYRDLMIYKNGAKIAHSRTQGHATAVCVIGVTTQDIAVPGDYYEAIVIHDAGAALNALSNGELTYASACRVY